MEITKQDFIDTQIEKMCRMCARKARVITKLNEELPDKGFLFEMQEKFHAIIDIDSRENR